MEILMSVNVPVETAQLGYSICNEVASTELHAELHVGRLQTNNYDYLCTA